MAKVLQLDPTNRNFKARTRANITTDGSAHTNSTDAATMASHTVAANAFSADDEIVIEGSINVTSGNAADTLTLAVKLGGSTLASSPAFDVADAGDVVSYRVVGYWRTIGATGKLVVKYACFTYSGGAGAVAVQGEITLNTTGTLACIVTADWSAASASDSCKSQAHGYHVE